MAFLAGNGSTANSAPPALRVRRGSATIGCGAFRQRRSKEVLQPAIRTKRADPRLQDLLALALLKSDTRRCASSVMSGALRRHTAHRRHAVSGAAWVATRRASTSPAAAARTPRAADAPRMVGGLSRATPRQLRNAHASDTAAGMPIAAPAHRRAKPPHPPGCGVENRPGLHGMSPRWATPQPTAKGLDHENPPQLPTSTSTEGYG